MKSVMLFLLRLYQLTISPYLGQNCRFYPSCSAYTDTAIRRHGLLKGGLLSGKRLCKCHPWHPGGVDLVPESENNTRQENQPNRHLPGQTGLKLARVPAATPASNEDHYPTE